MIAEACPSDYCREQKRPSVFVPILYFLLFSVRYSTATFLPLFISCLCNGLCRPSTTECWL